MESEMMNENSYFNMVYQLKEVLMIRVSDILKKIIRITLLKERMTARLGIKLKLRSIQLLKIIFVMIYQVIYSQFQRKFLTNTGI
ncbi:unnamed protein product [Paramecium sonneborni]|uniref:Uncharacterized protein n=1 Tax=Paramecium sonneborni TaxID=65129 RepID=A0A8S1RRT7_9CILI|nr:unnamed protein product [Paramecium sonneborni]